MGVFKTIDGGTTWTATNDGFPLTSGGFLARVSALAIDPAAHETIYAGTSDLGVFKSTDGGTRWVPITREHSHTHSLRIDPTTPSTLYGASSSDVFKSTDAGASWTTLRFDTYTYLTDLAIDPVMPSRVYAGLVGSPWATSGVVGSWDGGTSWRTLNDGLVSRDIKGLAVSGTTLFAATAAGVFQRTLGDIAPCETARCVIGAARQSAACATTSIPKRLRRTLDGAVRLIEAADRKTGRRCRTLAAARRECSCVPTG